MDAELPPDAELPATSLGRRKVRGPFPLWLLVLLVFFWLASVIWTISDLRKRTLASWSAWRLADEQLRLADFEMPEQPRPMAPQVADGDRQALMEHWAALCEKDPNSRSNAAAVILWHLAGQEERAYKAMVVDKGNPDQTEMLTALLNGGRGDAAVLARFRDSIAASGEVYWWEEQLWLEIAQRSKDPALPLVAEASGKRSRRCLAVMTWLGWVEMVLGAGGVIGLAVFLWHSRGKIRLGEVPAIFRMIGWRRLLAGVAVAEVLAAVLLFVADLSLERFFAWTHGSLAIYQTLWRACAPLLLMVMFFRMPSTAVRALRLDRNFSWAAVLGAVGLSIIVSGFCWWLLPHGSENEQGIQLDPWTFGLDGLWYILWIGCVVAPLCEEIVYRGFLFNAVSARFGFIPGLLVTNVLFSAIHGYGWDGAVSVFFCGVCSCLLYRVSGTLAAAVVYHSLFNFYAVTSAWFALEAPYW